MTQKNPSIEKKQTLEHREQTCGCHEVGGGNERDWEFEISRSKLLNMGWINNKVLLLAQRNHNGKEYEKEYI